MQWKNVFDSDIRLGFASGKVAPFRPDQSRLGCRDGDDGEVYEAYRFVQRGQIQGSNMAFRAKCLAAAGLFDHRFGAGTPFAGEEWDVALRASKSGWAGGYFPGPTVLHDHGRAPGPVEMRHERFYDYGGGAVYAKATPSWGLPIVLRAALGEVWRTRDAGRFIAFARGALDYILRGKSERRVG
jgi:GT2 family glycosyltransferase